MEVVHDYSEQLSEIIRNSFDTYKKIEKQAHDGFHVDNSDNSVTVHNVIETSKRKK